MSCSGPDLTTSIKTIQRLLMETSALTELHIYAQFSSLLRLTPFPNNFIDSLVAKFGTQLKRLTLNRFRISQMSLETICGGLPLLEGLHVTLIELKLVSRMSRGVLTEMIFAVHNRYPTISDEASTNCPLIIPILCRVCWNFWHEQPG